MIQLRGCLFSLFFISLPWFVSTRTTYSSTLVRKKNEFITNKKVVIKIDFLYFWAATINDFKHLLAKEEFKALRFQKHL